jgi:DNA-binding YbaB/EbfC family protein
MAINPFDFIKNFKNIQTRMTEMQGKLDLITAQGSSGGGLVKIVLNGKLEMISIDIAPEIFSADERITVQDLVRAAYTDASVKIKDKMREELNTVTGGMDIPPGLMGM